MELVREFGKDDLAKVYVLRMREGDGSLIECVESLQPPRSRSEKWVVIVSTLFGCPVKCKICDAGGIYQGRLEAEEILDQVRFLVDRRFGGRRVPSRKFKIQFARMGDPALNPAVLDVLERLPGEIEAPGLVPSVSSVGPMGTEGFFGRLKAIKDRLYGDGRFQLQFSIHTTDPAVRRSIIPVKGLDFPWMGRFASRFRESGDQRVTLNFVAARGFPVDPHALLPHFDPADCLIKITPLNPTVSGAKAGLTSLIHPERPQTAERLVRSFEEAGYPVILSIGEAEENAIGSNCGQYATWVQRGLVTIKEGFATEGHPCNL